VALNGVGSIKRYHIGKVYRRDNPAMNRGRFREFYQCDFDIAGSHSSAVADAEVVKVLDEILSDLDIGPYVIKLNHRRLLDAIMDISGVPPPKFRPICSAIDKLDKAEWGEVRREMTEEKGLPGEVANRIGEFVKLRGAPFGMLRELGEIPELAGHAGAAAALAELGTFFELLEAMGGLGKVSFDLSLARGLDYYTGVIYEAVLMGGKKDEGGQEVHVGSVAAGGRCVDLTSC
jgi:histidyl-tRNA synthetase